MAGAGGAGSGARASAAVTKPKVAIPSVLNIGARPDTAIPVYLRKTEHLPCANPAPKVRTSSSETRITIDTSTPGAFIDPQTSYITFDLEIESADPDREFFVQFGKCGVHGIVESTQLMCQGVPLEPLDEYGYLMSALMDMYGVTAGSSGNIVRHMQGIPTQKQAHRIYMDNFDAKGRPEVYGSRYNHPNDRVHIATETTPSLTSAGSAADVDIRFDDVYYDQAGSTGQQSTFPYMAAGQIASSSKRKIVVNYKIPLLSGILGTAASRYFPAFLISPGTLEWVIKFAPVQKCMQSTAQLSRDLQENGYGLDVQEPDTVPFVQDASAQIANYKVMNLRYVAQQLIVNESIASDIVKRAMKGDVSILTQSWRYTSIRIENPTQQDQQLIMQQKLASAKLSLLTFHESDAEGKPGVLPYSRTSIGQTYNPNDSATWQLRIGNDTYPQKPVDTATETLVEVERAMQQFGDLRHESGLLTQYNLDNYNGYASDFTANLWHGMLGYTKKAGNSLYPYQQVIAMDNHPSQVVGELTEYPITHDDGLFGTASALRNEITNAFVGDVDTTLNLEHRWYEVTYNTNNTAGKRGVVADPPVPLDFTQYEVLEIRIIQYSSSGNPDFGSTRVFQHKVQRAELANVNAVVQKMQQALDELTSGAYKEQWWSTSYNKPLLRVGWAAPGKGFDDVTGNFSQGKLFTMDGLDSPNDNYTMRLNYACSPVLADALGIKSMGLTFANDYLNDYNQHVAGYVFVSDDGTDVLLRQVVDLQQQMPRRIAVNETCMLEQTGNTNAYRVAHNLLLGGGSGRPDWEVPSIWPSLAQIPSIDPVQGLHSPTYSHTLHVERPIASHSNFLIAINHDTFPDQGGTLRSGRLLGNNTLFLEMHKCRFRRQMFTNYRLPEANDMELLVFPDYISAKENTGRPNDYTGKSILCRYWVLHDLRVSIQSGGIMQSFY